MAPLQRAYFQATVSEFIERDGAAILGELVRAHGFAVDPLQRNSWEHQIKALRRLLADYPTAHIYLF